MDEARVHEIYEELGKLVVELPRDPGSLGPTYFQDLISRVRGYLNQSSVYLTEVLREQHHEEMDLEALEAAFQISSDDHMANNRQVSTLPAIQDRVSMVNVLLASERRAIVAKKRILKNLSHVEKVIRHRHKELENTMSAIRLQRSLFETEIRTGSSYGDESDQSRGSRWGRAGARPEEDMTEEEIAKLIEDELATGTSPERPAAETLDTEIADLLEEAEKAGTFEAQPVVESPAENHNGQGSPPAPVEEEDADIRRFLSQEEDDSDLFKDL